MPSLNHSYLNFTFLFPTGENPSCQDCGNVLLFLIIYNLFSKCIKFWGYISEFLIGLTISVTIVCSVAYRYRKSISIIELFVSIISIYIGFLATNFWRSLSKFTGWAIIEELSIRGRVRRFLSSWGQRAHVKLYNIDLSSYDFWFALICIDMNVISALSTAIQQFRYVFDSK